jgi:hypothetical protein
MTAISRGKHELTNPYTSFQDYLYMFGERDFDFFVFSYSIANHSFPHNLTMKNYVAIKGVSSSSFTLRWLGNKASEENSITKR